MDYIPAFIISIITEHIEANFPILQDCEYVFTLEGVAPGQCSYNKLKFPSLQWLKATYAKENMAIAYFPLPSPDIDVVKSKRKKKRSQSPFEMVPIALENFSEEEEDENDEDYIESTKPGGDVITPSYLSGDYVRDGVGVTEVESEVDSDNPDNA